MRAKTITIFCVCAALLLTALVITAKNRHATGPGPGGGSGGDDGSFATSGDVLKLTGQLDNRYLGTGDNDVHMLVDVTSADIEGTEARSALDVIVVIDRSGSMLDQSKLDAAKSAARQLVRKLQDGDRVALVSYGTDVTVESQMVSVSPTTRSQVLGAIDRLQAHGATNLSGGIEVALELFEKHSDETRTRRMLLLSDGHPTAGEMDPNRLANLAGTARGKGISVTSMGLGLDYNELLMTDIAKTGGGNYHFIAAASDLTETFEREFATLEKLVARRARLTVKTAPGVTVQRVHGFAWSSKADTTEIELGDFPADTRRSLMVVLDVQPRSGETVPVVDLDLNYVKVDGAPAHHEVALSMTPTDDAAKVEAGIRRDVVLYKERVETANLYEQAMDRFEKGEKDEARRMLKERSNVLRQLSKTLADPSLEEEAEAAQAVGDKVGAASPTANDGKLLLKKTRATSFEAKRKR